MHKQAIRGEPAWLPAPVVPVTPMYGIAPRSAGSGDIESLFGHFLSLCHAQRLAPRQVVSRLLPEVERQMDGASLPRRYQIGWAWDKHAGKEMIGMHRPAERWVCVLEAATGLAGLRAATLLPLDALTTGNLITDDERICTACLVEDVAAGGLPYERLLWRMRPVTCCPIHRRRLLVPQCGQELRATRSEYFRIKLCGVCQQCGPIGHKCSRIEAESATNEEVWRAEQCRRVLRALHAIELAGPNPVRTAVRDHCAERGAMSSLAFRAGAPKSVRSEWLRNSEVRLSFEQLLDICAVEELELADLLQGRLCQADGPGGMEPARARQRRNPVDHHAVRQALMAALRDGQSVTEVAKAIRVDLATLAQHRDLYVPVREATVRRKAEEEQARHLAAIQRVEVMARNVAKRGKRLTHRNALREGSSSFAPSSIESTVFSVMRMALGDRSAHSPAAAQRLGPRFLQRISEAAGRLRPEFGDAQMYFPFAPD